MKTTLKPLLLPLVLALGTAGLFIARSARGQYNSWCDNPAPTPQPTPQPTPAPKCQPEDPCKHCTSSPCYVASGTYVTKAKDLTVRTAGFPIEIERQYRSTLAIDGTSGYGWTSSITPRIYYALYLFTAPSTYQKKAAVIMPDGGRYTYTDNGNGTFTPPVGRYDILVRNADGSFDLKIQRTMSVLHFGPSGALETMKDDYGNTITWTYDVNGRVQRIADSAGSGRYVDVTWGPNGRIATARDSSGRLVQYGYDASGNLTTVTDPVNRVTTYGYVQGRFVKLLNKVTDHWGRVVTQMTYDTTDRVTSYTDKGETYSYTYGYGGNPSVTAKTDSSGNVYQYPFAGEGFVSDTTPPAGGATHTDRYADGSVQMFRDAVGVKTYYTYTADGSPLTVTKDYLGPNSVRYDYVYDPNFPARAISATPRDPASGLVNPDWQAWQYDYYQTGSPAPGALFHVYRVRDTGVRETLATYEYNTRGQVTRYTHAGGGVTDYAYDAQTNLLTVKLPTNNDTGTRPVTTFGYDPLGRVTSVKDALNQTTLLTYDAVDRLVSRTLPKPTAGSMLNFTTTFAYDAYDAATGLVFRSATDPNSLVTAEGYDQFDRAGRMTDAAGHSTKYGYVRSLLSTMTDQNDNVTTYSYDAANRLNRVTYADGAYEGYGYTGDGLVNSKTDRLGHTLSYQYDAFKRLVTVTHPGGATITATYDGQKLMQVTDMSLSPTETTLYSYDSSYRVASVTEGSRGTINYQWTADDVVSNYAVQSGPSVTYTYYPDGSVNTMVWSAAAGQFKYSYLLTGVTSGLTLPNGGSRAFTYDNQGRLTQTTNLAPGGQSLATFTYGYDVDHSTGLNTKLGQRTSVTTTTTSPGWSGKLTKYEYDSLYQLKKVTYPNVAPYNGEVDSWTYDSIGNRLTNTINGVTQNLSYQKIGTNPANWQRLLSDGVSTYSYDANGSLITKSGAPGSFTYGWDYENRLTSVSGSATASYSYDYLSLRRSKTVGTATTSYLYDGYNLIRETGPATADYIFGPDIDQPLAMSTGGQIYYFAADGLDSTAALTNSAGAVQNTYIYDAWGQIRTETGSLSNPFTYTGRERGEAGLIYSRFRSLLPSVGRFVSEDPLAAKLGNAFASGYFDSPVSMPIYSYAMGSPVLRRDPLGLDAGGAGAGDQGALTCVEGCVEQYIIRQLQCEFRKVGGQIVCVAATAACARRPGWNCFAVPVCFKTVEYTYKTCQEGAATKYITCLQTCKCKS